MSENFTHYGRNWKDHLMGPSIGLNAFIIFESEEEEILEIDKALQTLVTTKIISNSTYDLKKYTDFLEAVKHSFHIPWTGISPRMRRLIYSINAIHQPNVIVCAGIFCGYTFICNAGASIGPGAYYNSEASTGIELLEKEANLAMENVEKFAPGEGNSIICDDAISWFTNKCNKKIDLLYLDAKSIDFDPRNQTYSNGPTKSLYLKILKKALPHLSPNALVLAHNSQNAKETIGDYLNFVRSDKFSASVNLIIDDAGLEVSKL
ncbi:MAG: hypothetical protein AAF731_04885 [Bacteroidota bacterium]